MQHHNPLLSLLNCKKPVIQAPMAGGVQNEDLAIAVCQAGGLGSLPAATISLEELARQIAAVRKQTDQAFAVNFFAHQPKAISTAQMQRWLDLLSPYFAELGISPADIPQSGGRQAFGEAQAEFVIQQGLAIVSFHFGLPEASLVAALKAKGIIIMASATTVSEALWLEAQGADIIIAQGLEAGGHRSMFLSDKPDTQLGLFSLLPQIRQAVKCPVIAAGGIVNSQTAKAAQILGADGVQAGSAFLLAHEATLSETHLAALQSKANQNTVLTNLISGGYARGLQNRFTRELGASHPAAPPFPLAQTATAALIQAAKTQGIPDFDYYWAGENIALAKRQSAAAIVQELASAWEISAQPHS